MKIAHISDIQIRFGSRHDEYKLVFERLYRDLEEQRPDRIAVLGDIHHHKVNMSPKLIDMSSSFLSSLSKIAPTDVIAGNHDLNLKNVDQGDGIASIVRLLNNGNIIEKDNYSNIDFWKNDIYYYPNSGFYDIGKNLIYGVYSCIDGEILSLEKSKKQKGKTYVALHHGTIFGSVMDNLYRLKNDDLLKIDAFDNFDIVMLGDIHEFQHFEREEEIEVDPSRVEEYLNNGWEML